MTNSINLSYFCIEKNNKQNQECWYFNTKSVQEKKYKFTGQIDLTHAFIKASNIFLFFLILILRWLSNFRFLTKIKPTQSIFFFLKINHPCWLYCVITSPSEKLNFRSLVFLSFFRIDNWSSLHNNWLQQLKRAYRGVIFAVVI